MPLHAASLQLRRLACSALLVALVLAQTLGLVHRIVHAPTGGHSALAVPVLASASASAAMEAGTRWLKALFSGHSSEQGCDLYDQLSHADAVPEAPAAAILAHGLDAVPTRHSAGQVAAQAAGFLARAPPPAG